MRANSMRKSVAVVSCALLLLQTQAASAIGLLQAYQAALQKDPIYLGAKAERVAGKEYEAIGRSGLLPSLQYSYSTSKNKGETISAPNVLNPDGIADQDYASTTRNVSLRQTLFNLDAYARFQQGVIQSQMSETQFSARAQELIVRLVSAYVDAKYAEDQLSLYTAQRDTYLEQRNLNDRMFAKGEGTRTDKLETQAKLDVSEAMLMEARDNFQNAKNALEIIVGQEVLKLDDLRADFRLYPLNENSLEAWREIANKNNPEIVAGRYAVEIAEKEIDKSRAAHAPRLDLNASYNRGLSETITTQKQDNNIRSVGVQLVIPIYSGGYASAVSKQSVARRDKAKTELDAATSKVHIELTKQFNAIKSSAAKIEALQKSVKSSELLVDATKQSIKGGVRINLDLLNAQQQLVTTKRDFAQARYTYLLSFLRLKAAAGVLDIADLQVIAGYFGSSN